jgi:hypothetical protein
VVEQVAALAQGTRLAPVGQDTHRAPALQALRHAMQEKAADARMRRQRQGLHTVALASVAGGKTHRAILPIDAAVGGDGHAVRGAAERVQPRPRAGHGLLGVDDPRLGIKLVDTAPEALRGRAGVGVCRQHRRSHGGAGVEGLKARAAADGTQGRDGAEETWMGCDPACPMRRQGSPWHQTGHVAMGSEGLVPGLQDWDATALAPQGLAAALEQRLAGSPQEQREPGAFVAQDQRMERMRQRKDAVAIRHGQACGLAGVAPLRLGQGLTRGAVAIAAGVRGRALKAAWRTLFGMSAERRGTTDHESVHPFVMARWPRMGGAIGGPRMPQDVGTFPRCSAWLRPRRHWGTAGGVRRHNVTPSADRGERQSTRDRTDWAPWPAAGG